MPPSAPVTPVERTARLILLLREPRTLEELRALLAISSAQLRRDLGDVRRAGWTVAEQGRPKSVWIEPEPLQSRSIPQT